VCVNEEMRVVEGSGTPNPGLRFHLCIYDKRPELQSIVHSHPPFASALSMADEAFVVAHMDATIVL